MESQPHAISCGFSHSCAISKTGQLYVWGDNSNQQIKPQQDHGPLKGQPQVITEPAVVRMQYKNEYQQKVFTFDQLKQSGLKLNKNIGSSGTDYKAIDVAAGPFCTFVLGIQQPDKTFIGKNKDVDVQRIVERLYQILMEDKTLIKMFCGLSKYVNKDKVSEDSFDFADEEQVTYNDKEDAYLLRCMNQDPFTIEIHKTAFVQAIIKARICVAHERIYIDDLVNKIMDFRDKRVENGAGTQPNEDCLILGDIEDFALGFMQNNVKLFLFGQAHKSLRAFEDVVQEVKDKTGMQELLTEAPKSERVQGRRPITGSKSQSEVNSKPIAIEFPKFTKPLMSIAAGSSHVLALTVDNEMFSWGSGHYGALGFDSYEDQNTPRKLEIRDYENVLYRITQVSCGKFHSICLTKRKALFTWGQGSQGRLGHGEAHLQDQLAPKEIYNLSQRKPIFIAAGESSSAAITESYQLYTWGSGGGGRLGHGEDCRETSPKLVQALEEYQTMFVSLGSFHSLAATVCGKVFCFGQNKYGKLGISPLYTKDGQVHALPVRIPMYSASPDGPKVAKNRNDIIQVTAGFNHSMALSKTGKVYSWGYQGKGLLGREDQNGTNRVPLPVGQQMTFTPTQKEELAEFIDSYVQSLGADQPHDLVLPALEEDGHEQCIHAEQVCCGTTNTVGLTSYGEVFVFGNNLYGQHGREEIKMAPIALKRGPEDQGEDWEIRYNLEDNVSRIAFPFKSPDKISQIACGGEHLFARSLLDEIYAWGRNDEGQLGVGYLKEKVTEPTLLENMCYKGTRQICCGDNYSAIVTLYGEVFVAGSLDGGKLGLGKGQRRGYQLLFRQIPNLPEIESVSCGVQHMLAISRKTDDPKSGGTYAWGKNHRGQLGIGTKDSHYSPQEVSGGIERLQKVCAGHNFSLGLSYTQKAYFWGNVKYLGEFGQVKDIVEPVVMKQLENSEVRDIACNYKQCYALIDKGEIMQWGKFLQQKYDNDTGQRSGIKKAKKKHGDQEQKICFFVKFSGPRTINFDQIITGQNHAAAVTANKRVYVWGYNTVNNRLGVRNLQQSNDASLAPQDFASLHDKIDHYKENIIEMNMKAAAESSEEESVQNQALATETVASAQEESKFTEDGSNELSDGEFQDQSAILSKDASLITAGKQQKASNKGGPTKTPQKNAGGSTEDFANQIINQIAQHNSKRKRGKQKKDAELSIFDPSIDLFALECIRQEIHVKQFPATRGSFFKQAGEDLVLANIMLQKLLKKEGKLQQDELGVQESGEKSMTMVANLIEQVQEFGKIQRQNNDIQMKTKTSFLARAAEKPFFVNTDLSVQLKELGMQSELIDDKKEVQAALTLYVTHPCYVIQLLKSELFSFEEQKMLIKQLFRSSKRSAQLRNNYLLISVFEHMLVHELKGKNLSEVDLHSKDCQMISVYIFKRVFKSQQTNLDTICCICCHLLNQVMSIEASGNSMEDDTLDVLGEVKGMVDKKGEKMATSPPSKKAQDLSKIILKVVDDILSNNILKGKGQMFDFKKKIKAQIDFIKKQFKDVQDEKGNLVSNSLSPMNNDPQKQNQMNYLAGIDADQITEKFPSIRFSEELYVMIEILNKQLRRLEFSAGNKDEDVSNQILGLIFIPHVSKIQDDIPLYMYPYIPKIKQIKFIQESLTVIHPLNIKNVFHTFICYMSGQAVFKAKEQESWNQNLNSRLSQHQQTNKILLIKKIQSYGKEINSLLPYKNFENLLVHCLEQDETKVSISKKLIGSIFHNLLNSIDKMVVYFPAKNDPLYKIVQKVNQSQGLEKLQDLNDYSDQVNLKLHTRLICKAEVTAKIDVFVRCNSCQATLEQDIAVQNYSESIVILQYEPQDKQSLVSSYCEVLRDSQTINPELLSKGDKKIQQDQNGQQSMRGKKIIPKGRMVEFVKQTQVYAKNNANYQLSVKLVEFSRLMEIEAGSLQHKMEAIQKAREEDPSYVPPLKGEDVEEVDQEVESKEALFIDLLSQAESKMHDRIAQNFNVQLIYTQVDRYLNPMLQARMASFKTKLMEANQLKSSNYQWGLANRDLLHLYDTPALKQMSQVREAKMSQKVSKSLGNLGGSKQPIRGFLEIDCKKLLANKTIRGSRLPEFEPLLPMCFLLMIESEDGQKIAFKLIFRQTKYNPCGADKVVQEQIMLKFDIEAKKLKELRTLKKSKDPSVDPTLVVFEENDTLEFDRKGFIQLLNQMDRQKQAQQPSGETEDTPKKKSKSSTKQ